MTHSLSIDRFEGDGKKIAVLVDDKDRPILFPRDLLPEGARPGDILALTIVRDTEATAKLQSETRQVEDELTGTDPGGDIKI